MNKTHPELELICIKLPNEAIPAYLNENTWSEESIIFVKEVIDSSRLLEINSIEVWNDYDKFVSQMSIATQ